MRTFVIVYFNHQNQEIGQVVTVASRKGQAYTQARLNWRAASVRFEISEI